MKTPRLFSPVRLQTGKRIALDAERAHYLVRVLRAKCGDMVTVFDGSGGEFAAEVLADARRNVQLVVGAHAETGVESPLSIHLVQGISRGERMDFVMQKATELGVARISPVLCERSVVRLGPARADKRLAHWLRIAQGACEQCGRNTIPTVDAPVEFAEWLSALDRPDPGGIILKPGAVELVASRGDDDRAITVAVGPEGGFSDGEYKLAEAAGLAPAGIGPRILRTETAALTAIAILQVRYGDLGRAL